MKTNFKIAGAVLIMSIVMIACDKSDNSLVPDPVDSVLDNQNGVPPANNFVKIGNDYVYPVYSLLSNLVSENFESEGRYYYSYLFRLVQEYPGDVVFPDESTDPKIPSLALNFKFFMEQNSDPVDGEWTVEYLPEIEQYYQPFDSVYAAGKTTIAFLSGGKASNDYNDYLTSQVRLKSGTFHLKKSGDLYVIYFNGETDDGKTVSCSYTDFIGAAIDQQFEASPEDYSTTEIPESYIEMGGKYYKLDDAYLWKGMINGSVEVDATRNYYRYEKNDAGAIVQHWKGHAMSFQFQLTDLDQLRTKTYHVVPSSNIYSIDSLTQIDGFPSDSLFIGSYYIASDILLTASSEDNRIFLQSGELTVTQYPSEYEFSGSFIDTQGQEVNVKFKAVWSPWGWWN